MMVFYGHNNVYSLAQMVKVKIEKIKYKVKGQNNRSIKSNSGGNTFHTFCSKCASNHDKLDLDQIWLKINQFKKIFEVLTKGT